jgi:hypothetical protein
VSKAIEVLLQMRQVIRSRFVAFLALTLIVANTLIPALNRSLGAPTNLLWVELCSGTSVKRIAVDTAGNVLSSNNAPVRGSQHGAEYCAYCSLQSQFWLIESPSVALSTFFAWTHPSAISYLTIAIKQRWGATPLSRGPPTRFV